MGDGAWLGDFLSGTKAYRSREEAEREACRLSDLNRAKGRTYVVLVLRLVEADCSE